MAESPHKSAGRMSCFSQCAYNFFESQSFHFLNKLFQNFQTLQTKQHTRGEQNKVSCTNTRYSVCINFEYNKNNKQPMVTEQNPLLPSRKW